MFLFNGNQFGHWLVKHFAAGTTQKSGVNWRSWNNDGNVGWMFWSALLGNAWLGIGFKVRHMI